MTKKRKNQNIFWTTEEDVQILNAVNNRGYLTKVDVFDKLSKLTNRSTDSIRNRYYKILRDGLKAEHSEKEVNKVMKYKKVPKKITKPVNVLFEVLTQEQKDAILRQLLGI